MGQPAARITDMHACPMVTPGLPPIPHVGGPISGPCAPTVLIGGLPAARITDMAVCVGPPDVIVKGSSSVIICGMPAARIGDTCGHGGVIVAGCPTVLIGDGGGGGAGGGSSASAGSGSGDIRSLAELSEALSHGGAMTAAAAQAKAMETAASVGAPFCERCTQA